MGLRLMTQMLERCTKDAKYCATTVTLCSFVLLELEVPDVPSYFLFATCFMQLCVHYFLSLPGRHHQVLAHLNYIQITLHC